MTIGIRGLRPLLQVFDMPTSLRFYRDVLGFAEVQKSGQGDEVHWAWLRHGDADVMLNTAYDDGERPPTSTDHDSPPTLIPVSSWGVRTLRARTPISWHRA